MIPRCAVLLSILVVLVAGAPALAGYEFSISASSTDPFDNTPPSSGGYRSIYLWLVCADNGFAGLEAGVNSDLHIVSFSPVNGVINAGSATDLLLAAGGCPTDSVVLGSWFIEDIGGYVCLVNSPSSNWLAAVDCDPEPNLTLMPEVVGFTSDATNPCVVIGNSCSQEAQASGLVIGYGQELTPPFEFTGIGTEALLLNGLQYFPQSDSSDELLVTPEIERKAAEIRAIVSAAYEETKNVPLEDRPQELARILTASGHTDSVTVYDDGLGVQWKDTAPTIWIPAEVRQQDARPPVDEPRKRLRIHHHLIEEFWDINERGGYVAFGADHFFRSIRSQTALRTRALLRDLKAGERVDNDRYEGTALNNERVREAVLRAMSLEDQR